jgi:hypothetical protein
LQSSRRSLPAWRWESRAGEWFPGAARTHPGLPEDHLTPASLTWASGHHGKDQQRHSQYSAHSPLDPHGGPPRLRFDPRIINNRCALCRFVQKVAPYPMRNPYRSKRSRSCSERRSFCYT